MLVYQRVEHFTILKAMVTWGSPIGRRTLSSMVLSIWRRVRRASFGGDWVAGIVVLKDIWDIAEVTNGNCGFDDLR